MPLLCAALAEPDFARSAAAVATPLAAGFDCDRVFIGMLQGRWLQVCAVSHGTLGGQDTTLLRALGAAIDEAADQHASVQHPQHPDDPPRITLAHADLAQRHALATLLTVPMFSASRVVGALLFEPRPGRRLDALALQQIEALALALAPLLGLQQGNEQSAWQRWRLRRAQQAAGPLQPVVKLALGVLGLGLVTTLPALPWPNQISTPTRLEGQVQRAVVAPVDGFLKSVAVRPGDAVRAGQVMARTE